MNINITAIPLYGRSDCKSRRSHFAFWEAIMQNYITMKTTKDWIEKIFLINARNK